MKLVHEFFFLLKQILVILKLEVGLVFVSAALPLVALPRRLATSILSTTLLTVPQLIIPIDNGQYWVLLRWQCATQRRWLLNSLEHLLLEQVPLVLELLPHSFHIVVEVFLFIGIIILLWDEVLLLGLLHLFLFLGAAVFRTGLKAAHAVDGVLFVAGPLHDEMLEILVGLLLFIFGAGAAL